MKHAPRHQREGIDRGSTEREPAVTRFGRLDILVNNAGVRLYHTVEEASDEVAACIVFLASDDASYFTGTLLFVDGGYPAM